MKSFLESNKSAREWLEEDMMVSPIYIDEEDYDPETDMIVGEYDEASKDALKKHDQGKYADGTRKRPGYDKEGKKIKKRKVRSTPKHRSTSSEKQKRKKQDKERSKKTTWRK